MKKNKKHPYKFGPTAQVIAAATLFALAVIASGDGVIAQWEINLFQLVYNLPDFLRPFFLVITQFGSIFVLGALLLIYVFKQRYHIVLRLMMTALLAYLASGFAKDIWGRARPHEILTDVVNLDYIVRGPGFPSGHTALATAMALTLWHYLPRKYRWVVPVWIIGVATSRMYLGIHFPLDIIGGFAIGWLSYALFRHVRLYDITSHHKAAGAKVRGSQMKTASRTKTRKIPKPIKA